MNDQHIKRLAQSYFQWNEERQLSGEHLKDPRVNSLCFEAYLAAVLNQADTTAQHIQNLPDRYQEKIGDGVDRLQTDKQTDADMLNLLETKLRDMYYAGYKVRFGEIGKVAKEIMSAVAVNKEAAVLTAKMEENTYSRSVVSRHGINAYGKLDERYEWIQAQQAKLNRRDDDETL